MNGVAGVQDGRARARRPAGLPQVKRNRSGLLAHLAGVAQRTPRAAPRRRGRHPVCQPVPDIPGKAGSGARTHGAGIRTGARRRL